MDELLTPISQSHRKAAPLLQEVQPESKKASTTRTAFKATSVDEAIESLKNEPDYGTLVSVLKYLLKVGSEDEPFCVTSPSPQSAKISQVLVTDIAPNYWALLKESELFDGGHSRKSRKTDLDLFLECLRGVTGLNACLTRLRGLIQEKKAEQGDVKRSDTDLNLRILLKLIAALLDGNDRVQKLWKSTAGGTISPIRRKPLAQEFLNLIGSGRIISLTAEAQDLVSSASGEKDILWMTDGSAYSMWLARGLVEWSSSQPSAEDRKLSSDLLSKTLRLGYHSNVVQLLLATLIEATEEATRSVTGLVSGLPHLEQRKITYTIIKQLTDLHLSRLDTTESSCGKDTVSAVAGAIDNIAGQDAARRADLVAWLTSSTGAGMGDSIMIRRAVLAVLSQNRDEIVAVFEKSLSQFGDQLYIKHSPMLQQEAHAQVLLLSAGYVQRLSPIKLSINLRSSTFMNAISNRLAASQTRARFLGMVVGEALSKLVHNAETKLNFNMEETSSEEGTWYKELVNISDSIGPVSILRTNPTKSTESSSQGPQIKPSAKKATPTISKAKAIIEEVDSESEDDDLKVYAKPDSDEEDSEDDPTLVRRDKPKAPVYIRDLIIYFRDTENYDRQKLALTTAPTLIRRKANYGTEVKEHAQELASLLVGLQDKYELDNFYQLRLQGMVALIVAQPQKMGQWFSKTFFDGDYSISQRASILTVLGLSARELAGFETSEYASAAEFASKKLPEKVEKLYIDEGKSKNQLQASSTLKSLPSNALDSISKSLTSTFLAPLAAEAADAATGPDALKLSTFTSRLKDKASSTVKAKAKPRVRAIPNTTAQLVSTSFFFPLTARFQNALHSTVGRVHGIVFQPLLLSLYLKTLALLLHAAGPSTLALPDMTSELWGLLLGSSVRAHAVGDLGITHAVLFTLLTLLDVNESRMRDLCQYQGKEIVETQEWVAQVFEGTRGEDGGEENEVKMLAAGILIRLRDGMEKYRMLLMGDMI